MRLAFAAGVLGGLLATGAAAAAPDGLFLQFDPQTTFRVALPPGSPTGEASIREHALAWHPLKRKYYLVADVVPLGNPHHPNTYDTELCLWSSPDLAAWTFHGVAVPKGTAGKTYDGYGVASPAGIAWFNGRLYVPFSARRTAQFTRRSIGLAWSGPEPETVPWTKTAAPVSDLEGEDDDAAAVALAGDDKLHLYHRATGPNGYRIVHTASATPEQTDSWPAAVEVTTRPPGVRAQELTGAVQADGMVRLFVIEHLTEGGGMKIAHLVSRDPAAMFVPADPGRRHVDNQPPKLSYGGHLTPVMREGTLVALFWTVFQSGNRYGLEGHPAALQKKGSQAAPNVSRLERSYWLHASLASLPQKGYWGPDFAPATKPADFEIQHAARLLAGAYAANRLYLIYHNEISPDDAEEVFTCWRRHCPTEVEIVPTLVLRAYDKPNSEVFPADTLRRLAVFCKRAINRKRIALYDVHGKRDQGDGLAILAKEFPDGLIRVGLQPGETIESPFAAAVQDTWSAFCHGKTNEDWQQPGFGAQTLRQWVGHRNGGSRPVSWDLIVVAWDYGPTRRGEYPGYDDAAKNMPLPAGRNTLALQEILRHARWEVLAGFSSDLFILHVNSRAATHDGPAGSFYERLRQGEIYGGYYAGPFREIIAIYRSLGQGHVPAAGPANR